MKALEDQEKISDQTFQDILSAEHSTEEFRMSTEREINAKRMKKIEDKHLADLGVVAAHHEEEMKALKSKHNEEINNIKTKYRYIRDMLREVLKK